MVERGENKNPLLTFEQQVMESIRRKLADSPMPVDILDICDRELLQFREEFISELYQEIKLLDSDFFEDPNPVVKNVFPRVDTSPGIIDGKITFGDLWKRSPYGKEEKLRLLRAKVGYVGFGGIQLSAQLLARAGVGNFIISDPDIFESTNANRQAFCFGETLGSPKVEVGVEFLKGINSQIGVEGHRISCTAEDLENIYSDVDVLIDGSGDIKLRTELHKFARRVGKPILSWAWAGWEGQYLTFFPDDPLYYEVFSYSPYTWDRGFDASGLGILNGYVAKDSVNLILGNYQKVVKYPYLATFCMHRQNIVQIRDVRYLKQRNEGRTES